VTALAPTGAPADQAAPAAAEFPHVVELLAELRWRNALRLPDPVGRVDEDGAAAIDLAGELIQLTEGLGWDEPVRAAMALMPEVVR